MKAEQKKKKKTQEGQGGGGQPGESPGPCYGLGWFVPLAYIIRFSMKMCCMGVVVKDVEGEGGGGGRGCAACARRPGFGV